MHSVIRIIVYAQDRESALCRARTILNNHLAGDEKPFDYGVFFDENEAGAGKQRWGSYPVVASVKSQIGQKLIADGMKFTKDDFMGYMEKIRRLTAFFTDEELFNLSSKDNKKIMLADIEGNKDLFNELRMAQYYFYCVGKYKGSGIWIYDNDGEGIRTEEHLKNVLNKWNNEEHKDLKVWVVPVDVHS